VASSIAQLLDLRQIELRDVKKEVRGLRSDLAALNQTSRQQYQLLEQFMAKFAPS
jgi:hypothetical protein